MQRVVSPHFLGGVMKILSLRFGAALFAALFLVSTSAVAATDNIGSVAEIVRSASATPLDGAAKPVKTKDGINQYDTIETVAKGGIKINFIDETELQLGGNSRLLIDEMVFDPASLQGKSVINLLAGTYVFVSGKMPKENVDIRTPSATIGIRGTEFTVQVSDTGATSVSVIDGLVEMTSIATGGQVSIPAGSNSSVSESGAVAEVAVGLVPTGDTVVDSAAQVLVAQVAATNAAKAVQETQTTTETQEQPAEEPQTAVTQPEQETTSVAPEATPETSGGNGNRNTTIPVQANVSKAQGAASKFSGREVNYNVNTRQFETDVRDQKLNGPGRNVPNGVARGNAGSTETATDAPAAAAGVPDLGASSTLKPVNAKAAISSSKSQAAVKSASNNGKALGLVNGNNGRGPGSNNGNGPGNNNGNNGNGPGNNNGNGPGNNNGQGNGNN